MTEQELVALAQAHVDAECTGDIEKAADTLADDIVYEHPFYDHVLKGKDVLRSYYASRWSESPITADAVARYWISGDDTIIVELRNPPHIAKSDTSVAVLTFNPDGSLAREISYSPAVRNSYSFKPAS
jgi:ketosteroid isomerase-like protein